VSKGQTREYGLAQLEVKNPIGILEGLSPSSRIWMSHFDTVQTLAEGFEILASTEDCPTAVVGNVEKNHYGIQFHAEVTHSQEGMKLLDNFLKLCKAERDWNMKQFIQDEMEKIKEKVGDKKVFLLVSGGVDSTVCFALLEKALGPERVYGMLVDTGLMRYQEAEKVKKALNAAGFNNLHVADKKDLFLERLKGVSEPEAKRKIIGELFWEVKESVAEELGLNAEEWIMGQGTIYPDTIESGGTKNADKIKTHHNRVDLVQEMIAAGRVIEPIAELYKDEVRELGEELGLPHALVWRHPFPGPGLGVRLLCTDHAEVERHEDFEPLSDAITDFIRSRFAGLEIVAKVLPCKSVGVQGDERTYAHPVALFTTLREWDTLEQISTALTNNFPQINRVMLVLKGEMGHFNLKLADTSAERVELLQRVDHAVTGVMAEAPYTYDIWQFPVVLVPVSTMEAQESIVLRPIVSTEAMTASFAKIDAVTLEKLTEKIVAHPGLTHIFYDLTHKPPGTIEWE